MMVAPIPSHEFSPWDFWREAPDDERAAQRAHVQALAGEHPDYRFGRDVFVARHASIANDELRLGDRSYIAAGAYLTGRLRTGADCSINPYAVVRGEVTLDDGVRVGAHTSILGFNHSMAPDTSVHEVNNRTLREVPIQAVMQAAAPQCIALTLDAEDDAAATWLTAAELSSTEGRIIPTWLAADVAKRGSKQERMEVIEILYGTAALAGLPPVKAVQTELDVPHRTASDWIKKARAAGRLDGMTYIVGRQADG